MSFYWNGYFSGNYITTTKRRSLANNSSTLSTDKSKREVEKSIKDFLCFLYDICQAKYTK